MFRFVAILVVFVSLVPGSGAQESIVVETLEGKIQGRLLGIDEAGDLSVQDERSGERVQYALAQVVSFRGLASKAVAEEKKTRVELFNGDQFVGIFKGADEEFVHIDSIELGRIDLPLLSVRLIQFPIREGQDEIHNYEPPESKEQDVLYLRPDGDRLAGTLEGLDETSVTLTWDVSGEAIQKTWDQIARMQFGDQGFPVPTSSDLLAIIETADGARFQAKILSFRDRVLRVQSVYEDLPVLEVSLSSLVRATIRNGQFVYASDLEETYRFVPYFDGQLGFRKDRNWGGGPMLLNGVQHAKGLGVHSRSLLTYSLGGKYQRFRTVIGIDESVKLREKSLPTSAHASVIFRVHVDGKVVFDSGLMSSRTGTLRVDVSLEGAQEMVLEVDFGENAHVNDWANWASAMLLR
ncbi:MAG: NPCBM/NEW2 domain-containing protein [Planctomycetota bacterium]|nr:NPCBM/NEW2 domain-containing protein [Planctomycetota bacterium]